MRHAMIASLQRVAIALGLAALIAPARAQVTYSYSFPAPTTITEYDGSTKPTGGSPTFNRPIGNGNLPPTSLSGIGTSVSYATKTITIPTDGNYDIAYDSVSPAGWDNYLFIYAGSFDPANALANGVAGNEAAFGIGHSGFKNLPLTAGTYVLVTTAYDNGVTGSFTVSVTPSPTLGSPVFTTSNTTAPASGSPIFNRPLANGNSAPTSLSSVGTAVYYQAQSFTVATSGTYRFLSTCVSPSAWDNYAFLYKDAFNPASPLTNCLIGNDGTTSSSAGFDYALTAGTTYYFVTSSYDNGVTGTFTNTVSPVTASVYDSYSDTTVGGPTFKRPVAGTPPSSLSGVGTAVNYQQHTFVSPVTATVTFNSVPVSPSGWDHFVCLYQTSFNPASGLTNCKVASDSGNFTYAVTSGTTYIIVTMAFSNGVTGTFSNTVTGSATVGSPVVSYNGGLTAGTGATFDRPDANGNSAPTTLSSTATATYYHADSFTVPATGVYSVLSKGTTPTNWDNYAVLYQTSFNPASPLTNVLLANDNQTTAGTAGFSSVTLSMGTTYILVTTGTANSNFGAYDVTVAPVTSGAAIITYSDATTLGTGPTFNRPDANGTSAPTALSTTATADYYHAYTFTVPTADTYSVVSAGTSPAGWDTYFVLYHDSFDPAAPLTNAVIASDTAPFSVSLTTGTTYVLVTTGYANSNIGDFHNKITQGGGTYPPVIPDDDPTGLSATLTVPDSFPIRSLDKVVIKGLNHGWAGDLLATLTHNGVTVELFDRVGRTTTTGYGSSSDFAGDYTFTLTGADLLAAAANSPIPAGTDYAPFLNGTIGESGSDTDTFASFAGGDAQGEWVLQISDLASLLTGSYTGFSITLTPDTASVSGVITLDSVSPTAPAQKVTFLFHPTDNSGDVTVTANITPAGTYTITGLPKKAGTLHIKGAKYLAVNVAVDLTAGDVSGVNATLPGADATNDNIVDTADFGALVNAYNNSYNVNDPMADPNLVAADFNFDGVIDTADFGVLVNNYSNIGDPLP